MDALRRGVLARSRLGQHQNRHIALRQLPDHCLHRPHTRAYAFHKRKFSRRYR
jgi:hypothetical protein